tara:strand:- start:329 stop:1492 length:1164 start_codon:yes stop_codon:yes gene_type:complete
MSADIYEDDLAVYATTAWHKKGYVHGELLDNDDYLNHPWPFYAERGELYVHNPTWIQWQQLLTDEKYHASALRTQSGALGPEMISTRVALRSHPLNVNTINGMPQDPQEFIPVSKFEGVTQTQWIRRSDNGYPLNIGITEQRALTQYQMMDEVVESLLERGFATGVESKGTLQHGRKGYVTLQVGEPIDIENYSKINRYFTLADAQDSSVSLSARPTLGVVVCANTFAAYILNNSTATWTIRHTRNAKEYLDAAIGTFYANLELQQEINKTVEQWIDAAFTEGQFIDMTKGLLPERPEDSKDNAKAVSQWDNRFKAIIDRYRGDDLEGFIRYTKWGALMAIQGYEQHVQKGKGRSTQGKHVDQLVFGDMPLTAKAAVLLKPETLVTV